MTPITGTLFMRLGVFLLTAATAVAGCAPTAHAHGVTAPTSSPAAAGPLYGFGDSYVEGTASVTPWLTRVGGELHRPVVNDGHGGDMAADTWQVARTVT